MAEVLPRLLYVATVATHLRAFHMPFIEMLERSGYEVEVACNLDVPLPGSRTVWDVPFSRNPYTWRNARAFAALQRVLSRGYALIHTHTPVASFLARLAARGSDARVLYTAHGFHFYAGAPLWNSVLYRSAERLAARWTDALTVMNEEDLHSGRRLGFRDGETLFRTHGVGLDLAYYSSAHRASDAALNRELGLHAAAPVALCIAEFIPRKGHQYLLEAWRAVLGRTPEARLILAGCGPCESSIRAQIQAAGMNHTVLVLGFRTDIPRLITRSAVVVQTSRQEGLPRALMEAMAVSRPVIATDIRGNRDLVQHGVTGFLVAPDKPLELASRLVSLLGDLHLRQTMGEEARRQVQPYALPLVLEEYASIYRKLGLDVAGPSVPRSV